MLQNHLPSGFLVSHFAVLNHLVRVQDSRTPLELAQIFQVAKTTMSHTLSGLENAGLVEMRANEQDARSKKVWITKKGQQFRENAIKSTGNDASEILSKFPEKRIAKVLLDELRSEK